LIGLATSYDTEARMPAPPVGVIGQNLFIHGFLIGFGRGGDKKPNATVELRIYDEAKRPTLTKPLMAVVPKDIPDAEDAAAVRFLLPLNREGTFTAELKATDATSGKTATVAIPIRVLAPGQVTVPGHNPGVGWVEGAERPRPTEIGTRWASVAPLPRPTLRRLK